VRLNPETVVVANGIVHISSILVVFTAPGCKSPGQVGSFGQLASAGEACRQQKRMAVHSPASARPDLNLRPKPIRKAIVICNAFLIQRSAGFCLTTDLRD
jgi:hypothetical protein